MSDEPEIVEGFPYPQWMDEAQVSEVTGYTISTLQSMRSRGQGPAYAKAGKVLYRRSDVEDFLQDRRNRQEIAMAERREKNGIVDAPTVVEEDDNGLF
jgi:hypothetical protein